MTSERAKLPGASQVVRLKDIAARCQVSVATVSQAFRESPHVSPETRERIKEVAREMGYTPSHNAAARRLIYQRFGRSMVYRNIALFTQSSVFHISFVTAFYQGVLEEVAVQDYALLTFFYPEQGISAMPLALDRGDVDGIILTPGPAVQGMVDQVRRHPLLQQCPIVSTYLAMASGSGVFADIQDGAVQVTRHLLDLGHRHFLTFASEPERNDLRISGIRQALTAADLNPQQHLHFLPRMHLWGNPRHLIDNNPVEVAQNHASEQQLLTFLYAHPQITAILGTNDSYAIHAWNALQRVGYRVPDDYSVAGFDDTDPKPDLYGCNQLTSVHLPLVEMGREAVRVLIRQVESGVRADEQIVLPTSLFVRQSTGPVPEHRLSVS